MSRRIKPKENMCAFRMKEIGRNLGGPPKGQKKGATVRNVFGMSRPKVAQKGPSWC